MSKYYYFADINQYEQGRCIGEGSYSQVFEVKDINTERIFAGKVLNKEIFKESIDDVDIQELLREINFLYFSKHPSVLKLIGYSPISFNNSSHPIIITELAKYSLRDVLQLEQKSQSPNGWNFTKKYICIYGIALGLSFIHSNKIIHRDLKPENILVNDKLYPKISDFGLSKITQSISKSINRSSLDFIKGSFLYLAPEIIEYEKYSNLSDVYAFGIICYEIFNGKSPFDNYGRYRIMIAHLNKERPTIDNDIPLFYRNLIEKCWSHNPEDRPTMDKVVEEIEKCTEIRENDLFDEIEFNEYLEFVKNSEISFDTSHPIHSDDLTIIKGKLEKVLEIEKVVEIEKEPESEVESEAKSDDAFKSEAENEAKSDDVVIKSEAENEAKSDDVVLKNEVESEAKSDDVVLKNEVESEAKNDDAVFKSDLNDIFFKKTIFHRKSFHHLKQKSVHFVEYPINEYEKLNQECKNLIQKAKTDPEIQFIVGRNLIEGNHNFPKNIEIGVKYLLNSISCDCIDSLIYYCQMLYDGRFIPKNIEASKKYLKKKLDDSRALFLYGKIKKKENNLHKAKESFKKSARMGNIEAMYQYGKMLYKSEGCKRNIDLSIKYFQISKNNGYEKSQLFLDAYTKLKNLSCFNELNEKVQFLFILKVIKNDKTKVQFNDKDSMVHKEKWKQIKIEPKETEKLFSDEIFNSPNFTIFLRNFYSINIQIGYPSDNFISIYTVVSELKLKKIPIITISVVIKEGEKIITKNCFDSLTLIKFILIPPTITYIDIFAFKDCTSLVEITIPNFVTEIHQNAFENCSSLKQVLILSKLTYLADFAFKGCLSLTQIKIPNSVIYIGNNCFDGCSSLESISIPRSVTYIGSHAFLNCKSLTRISIPHSVTHIGSNAFESCSSLRLILIPPTVKKIEPSSFNRCSSLKLISKTPSQTSFGEFDLRPISSLSAVPFSIPSFVTLIGPNAFSRCSSLTEISISNSITEIGESAFKGCSNLKKITFCEPSSIFSIGEYAFSGCSSLTQISIPSAVTEIKKEAFICCSSLMKVDFDDHNSLMSIGDYAFFKCAKLEEISIPLSVKKIGVYAFSECKSLKKVAVPYFLNEICEKAFNGCSSLFQLNFETDGKKDELTSSFSIGEYAFSGCSSLYEISIPSSVTEICEGAFLNCLKLVKVKFDSPSTVASIGSSFCEGCRSMEMISIPSSVKTIGSNAFKNCLLLKKIELPSSLKKKIGKYLKELDNQVSISYT